MKKICLVFAGILAATHLFADVQWYTIEEALVRNAEHPRMILIDVFTDWCHWCASMDEDTFANDAVAAYLDEHFYPVKLNAEDKAPLVFDGVTYEYLESQGVHGFVYALLGGNLAYPAIAFFDSDLSVITVWKGFAGSASFDVLARYIGDRKYESMSWEDWQSEYCTSGSSQ